MNFNIILHSYAHFNSYYIFNHLYYIEEIVYKSYINYLDPKFKYINLYENYDRNTILTTLDLNNYFYDLNDIMNKLLYKKILNFYIILELKFYFHYKQLYKIHDELIQYIFHPLKIYKIIVTYGYDELDNFLS
jgi:hypothetical protein